MKKSELKQIIRDVIKEIIIEKPNTILESKKTNPKQDYISPEEYAKLKKKAGFHREDWEYDGEKGLYKNVSNYLREEVQVYTGRFLPDLEKFLQTQIRKGAITGMDVDDVDVAAEHMYNALVSNKRK